MAEVQDPHTGQWYPIEYADQFPSGNIRDGGVVYSHEGWTSPPPGYPGAGGTQPEPEAPAPSGGGGGNNWNGGSPPDMPLEPGHGWTFNGQDWVQTAGSGLGYSAPAQQPSYDYNQGANQPYQPSQPSGGGGGGGGGGGSSASHAPVGKIDYEEPGEIPVFDAPEWEAPPEFKYDKEFAAPDSTTLSQDPSFQFRMDQGRKALEASAAGRGLLRSGGTLKDLVDYGQNFATQEYANVYGRKFNEYKFDYDKEADIYQTNYGLSKDAFDRTYKGKYDEFAPKLKGWETKTTGKQRAQEAMFNRDWQTYIADKDRDLRLRQIEQGDWS